MSKINSLQELLIDELKDLYNAENQLTKALPKLAQAASNEDLKMAFEDHLEETKGHVELLEEAFSILDETPKGKTCKAMEGLVAEGKEAIEAKAPDAVKDAYLIGAAQRVEHYEIAAYGTARSFAEAIDEERVADILQQILDEEGAADKKLTSIAQKVNKVAMSEMEKVNS